MMSGQHIPIEENSDPLVDLKEYAFVLEAMYFNWNISESPQIELRKSVALKLSEALEVLRSREGCEDWNFKIWDGYRTLKVQKILYEEYFNQLRKELPAEKEEKIHRLTQDFVSKPSFDKKSPSPHNTGGAVDLTMVDGEGKEIEMGTAFDEFSQKANTQYFKLKNPPIHHKRMILKESLEAVGFKNYPEEWWHFSYGDQEWAYLSGEKKAFFGSIELV